MTKGLPRLVIGCGLIVSVVLAGRCFFSQSGTVDVFVFECRNVGTFTAELPLQTIVWVPKGTNTRVNLADPTLTDSAFSGRTMRANVGDIFSINREDALLTDIVAERTFQHRCLRL